MANCVDCSKPCSTDDNYSCKKCNYRIHYKCEFNANILPPAYSSYTPPQYAFAISNSPHFIFYCNNCLDSISALVNSN